MLDKKIDIRVLGRASNYEEVATMIEKILNKRSFLSGLAVFLNLKEDLRFDIEVSDGEGNDVYEIYFDGSFVPIALGFKSMIVIDFQRRGWEEFKSDPDKWKAKLISFLSHELLHQEQYKRGITLSNDKLPQDWTEDDYFSSKVEMMAWAKDAVEWEMINDRDIDTPSYDNPSAKPYKLRQELWSEFMKYYEFYKIDIGS